MESKNNTSEECKGIRVEYTWEGSIAEFLCPICIMDSGLSKEEISNMQFVEVPIEWLPINGHIDPRNNEVGYMYLIGYVVTQKHFINWYNENIPYLTIKCIRRKF